MADATLPGLLLTGTHAARPAATAVGSGALYSCSTHLLIYQSDGATWSTWATLTGSGMADPMTTRGDMIIRDATNTTARLGKGTANQVLTSDGTDIAWATPASGGSYTFSSEQNLSGGAAASMDFSSIPGTARHLVLEAMVRGAKAAGFDDLILKVNADSGSNYDLQGQLAFQTTNTANEGVGTAGWGVTAILCQPPAASATAGLFTSIRLYVPYYANTNIRKSIYCEIAEVTSEATGGLVVKHALLHWRSTSAITQLTFTFAGGNVAQNSIGSLYLVS